jgi:hypothetical protein
MSELIKSIKYKNHTIEIKLDDSPENPREWDNTGTMVFFHKRNSMGDKNHGLTRDMFNSWDELESHLIKEKNAGVVLPVYMYDHSGITISTKPFSCPWDSGQIGFIYVDKKSAKENFYSKKRKPYQVWNKELEKKVTECLESEIKIYDDYLNGNVYGFVITGPNGEEVEDGSRWGFIGDIEYCISEAKETVDSLFKFQKRLVLDKVSSSV